ncbi:hypothetical protein PHMEG_00010643 [Phytophthora megakarya]|uniref:Uncharacterized protein n=1 Tax=Phytophthora megakarya TaxID=4795 RepID=A0A225WD93_9STRA|nr:hypothetical protein PHMEG_00010643 [Phytophthora megakarya]
MEWPLLGVSSDNDREAGVPSTPPPAKKHKAAPRRTKTVTRQVKASDQSKPRWACGNDCHFVRECPDKEAKARNDAYLASLPPRTQPNQMKPPGNE